MASFTDPTNTINKKTQTALAVLGSVDSGKSSLVGCLTYKILDDGRGLTRSMVSKHPHEITSGQTSDVSTRMLELENGTIMTFVDLCGHEKYLKTTNWGITSSFADYAFLVVSSNRGMLPMTRQHLRLLISYNIPFCIVVTHIDMAPQEIHDTTKLSIRKVLANIGGTNTRVHFVNEFEDQFKSQDEMAQIESNATNAILDILLNIQNGKQMDYPVLSMSNKSGAFLQVLRNVMNGLSPRPLWSPGGEEIVLNNKNVIAFRNDLESKNLGHLMPKYTEFADGIFYIDSAYNPPGIGLVITGICRGKQVASGDILYLGPFGKQFYEVRVKTMHNNIRQLMPYHEDHDRGTMAISVITKKTDVQRKHITKGIVALTSMSLVKNICYRFKAIMTMYKSSKSITLRTGTTPVIHLNTIVQPARIIIDPSENNGATEVAFDGKTTSYAIVTFKFKLKPEFVEPHNLFVIRTGEIHAMGMVLSVTSIEDDTDANPDPVRAKRRTRRPLIKGMTGAGASVAKPPTKVNKSTV